MLNSAKQPYLGKNSANFIKCIAIVLMLYHHLFGFDYWHIQFVVEGYGWLSAFGKICIDLFAFLTGIAFFSQKRYEKGLYRLEKALTFLVQYWLICVLFIAIGLVFNEPMPDLKTFLLNLFGLETGVGGIIIDYTVLPPVPFYFGNQYVNVCHAWYVAFYLLALLSFPLLKHIDTGKGILADTAFLFVLVALFRGFTTLSGLDSVSLVKDYFDFFPVIALGYLVAKHQVFEKLDAIPTILTLAVGLIVLYIAIYMRCDLIDSMVFPIRPAHLYTPLLVFFFTKIGKLGNFVLKKIPSINRISLFAVKFVAANSMNIWYLHAIFNTPRQSLQELAFFPVTDFRILIWVFALLNVVSFLISFSQKMLVSFVKKPFEIVKSKRK